MSNHAMICLSYNCKFSNKKNISLPLHQVFSSLTVDDCVDSFNNLLVILFDKHVPLKKKLILNRPCSWFNDTIEKLIAERGIQHLETFSYTL